MQSKNLFGVGYGPYFEAKKKKALDTLDEQRRMFIAQKLGIPLEQTQPTMNDAQPTDPGEPSPEELQQQMQEVPDMETEMAQQAAQERTPASEKVKDIVEDPEATLIAQASNLKNKKEQKTMLAGYLANIPAEQKIESIDNILKKAPELASTFKELRKDVEDTLRAGAKATGNKYVVMQTQQFAPEQAAKVLESWRALPETQKTQNSIGQLEGLLEKLQNEKIDPRQKLDLSNALSFANWFSGSPNKVGVGYKAPTTDETRMLREAKLMETLTKLREQNLSGMDKYMQASKLGLVPKVESTDIQEIKAVNPLTGRGKGDKEFDESKPRNDADYLKFSGGLSFEKALRDYRDYLDKHGLQLNPWSEDYKQLTSLFNSALEQHRDWAKTGANWTAQERRLMTTQVVPSNLIGSAITEGAGALGMGGGKKAMVNVLDTLIKKVQVGREMMGRRLQSKYPKSKTSIPDLLRESKELAQQPLGQAGSTPTTSGPTQAPMSSEELQRLKKQKEDLLKKMGKQK